MKLIVGLGNPGKKFENTRHNLGFWLVDRLKTEPRSVLESGFFRNSSFINECGKEVKKTISRLEISLEDVLVIHDDFDLELGQFKLQFNRSAAGHKGVRSVINELDSKAFWRLRVGIGQLPPHSKCGGMDADDYVIGKFSPSEQEILNSLYPQILATVRDWLSRHSKTDVREQKCGSMSED